MAGLDTRPSARVTVATSPASVSRGFWAATTWCPSAWSAGIILLKHEPSAHRPCANTMLVLAGMSAPSARRETTDSRYGGPAAPGITRTRDSLAGDVLASPLPRRAAVVPGERPVEGGIGLVAGAPGDLLGRFPGKIGRAS